MTGVNPPLNPDPLVQTESVTHISYHTHWHVTNDGVAEQVHALRTEMRTAMTEAAGTQQEQLDTIVAAITQGVTELRDEITRLAAANPAVDFTAAQALADALATDNIPAVEEPPVG